LSITRAPRHPQTISTSSSSFTLDFPSKTGLGLPSAQIRNIFQRGAPTEKGRGGALVKKRIEEEQTRIYKDEQDENDEEAGVEDLRSIYQKYLSGQIEKKCVVRSGEQWTSRYRDRRRELAHKKMRQASEKSAIPEDPVENKDTTQTVLAKQTMLAKRYQRRLVVPFRETTATNQQQEPQQSQRTMNTTAG